MGKTNTNGVWLPERHGGPHALRYLLLQYGAEEHHRSLYPRPCANLNTPPPPAADPFLCSTDIRNAGSARYATTYAVQLLDGPLICRNTASVDLDECIARLYRKELLADSVIEAICAKTKELLMKESNVGHILSPVTVVGDIHGQFFDMIEIFKIGGYCPDTNYLFLGKDRSHEHLPDIMRGRGIHANTLDMQVTTSTAGFSASRPSPSSSASNYATPSGCTSFVATTNHAA